MDNLKTFQAEQKKLRKIVLSAGLDEDLKWMHPCYTLNGNNVVLIHAFKDYCALLFFKGALMKDPNSLLIQQTKNVQERRQLRFSSVKQILKTEKIIKKYVAEAIKLDKLGTTFKYKQTHEFEIPQELEDKFAELPRFKEAFQSLTPGRQRGYLIFFASAKQSSTRAQRIEKYVDAIMDGIGLNDDYSK